MVGLLLKAFLNIVVSLDTKGCICHFVKWQIHSFYPRRHNILSLTSLIVLFGYKNGSTEIVHNFEMHLILGRHIYSG